MREPTVPKPSPRITTDEFPNPTRYLAQLVGDRELASDLLQDTFYDALTSRSSLGQADNPEAWLLASRATARSVPYGGAHASSERASERAFARLVLMDRESPRADEDIVALRELLRRTLSPEDTSILLLRYLHDFTSPEIAEITGLTATAVRKRLSRATQLLRGAIGEHDWRSADGR